MEKQYVFLLVLTTNFPIFGFQILKRVAVAWSETNKNEGKKAKKDWSKQTGTWVISQVHVVYDHSEFSSKKKILYFAICSLSDLSSLGSSLWSNDQNM